MTIHDVTTWVLGVGIERPQNTGSSRVPTMTGPRVLQDPRPTMCLWAMSHVSWTLQEARG